MRLKNWLNIFYISLLLTNCNSDITQAENKTALFVIIGDNFILPTEALHKNFIANFNKWATLPKTKDLVHIFVHPNNINQTKGLSGHIH